MGIINTTSDSFSDGGDYESIESAIKCAKQMQLDGADIIDIGGESSKPNATPVSLQQELQRVIPVIEAIRPIIDLPISIDTYKPEVMEAAVLAGANLVNDITALNSDHSIQVVKDLDVPICLMHMQGTPQTMQNNPTYVDVNLEIIDFFNRKLDQLYNLGIKSDKIIIDPGFGFGKTFKHNLTILKNLDKIQQLGLPILVGLSRKKMLGDMLQLKHPKDRLIGSVTAAILAVQNGANIVRVHDVLATKQALTILKFVGKHNEQ